MKKLLISSLVVMVVSFQFTLAQDTTVNSNSFNFPSRTCGISIGNSTEFSGLRFNLADEQVKEINGVNVTFWLKFAKNQEAVVNGLSLGVIPTGGSLQSLNIGLLGVGAHHNIYGLNLSGGVLGASGNIGGVSISGLLAMALGKESKLSGLTVAGLGAAGSKSINGVAFGGFVVGTEGSINGFGITCGYLVAKNLSGLAVAGFSNTQQMTGISIALFNRTKELHGLQIGILNNADNNWSLFKWLPVMNMNFGN